MNSGRFAVLIPVIVCLALSITLASCGPTAGLGMSHRNPDGSSDAKAAQGSPGVPRDSPLARITSGMTDTEVRRILGEPDDIKSYMTGKGFIPFYGGVDTMRAEFVYMGVGYITLSRDRKSGEMRVVAVRGDTAREP